MKFKRKIYEKLLEWKKNRNGKTALLIEGARRVGKSLVMSHSWGWNSLDCRCTSKLLCYA